MAAYCSTPEGVFVGFTRGPREVEDARLGCSTPEGVFVGFTATPDPRVRSGNFCSTPEGVFVGFTPEPRRGGRPARLLNARGRLRRVHPGRPDDGRGDQRLLNARGRLRRVHQTPEPGEHRQGEAAQRPRASSSGSRRGTRRSGGRRRLLNARGRLRRVHERVIRGDGEVIACSTPEGVFVGFTSWTGRRSWPPAAAQRPRASSSGSPVQGGDPGGPVDCSTPEGVFVGFTANTASFCRGLIGCSTPEGVFVGFTLLRHPGGDGELLLNARGRLRRVHRPGGAHGGRRPRLLNARGRLRRVHPAALRPEGGAVAPCSTPEGVFVGFTRSAPVRSASARTAAQRPRASSSGSRGTDLPEALVQDLLNARGRLRRVHTAPPPRAAGPWRSAQRPRASSSGSPSPARRRRPA